MTNMRLLRAAALVAAALLSNGAGASVRGNEASEALVKEANVLVATRRYQEAVNKFMDAAKADPSSSFALSMLAGLLRDLSVGVPAEQAQQLRGQAEGVVQAALKIEASDPLALEVLRLLNDDKPPPLHVPTPRAEALIAEGEALFGQRKYSEALAVYERAAKADPASSQPLVYAADCYFAEKKWPEAEARFAQATRLEPLNGQAWRYLADALAAQGKRAEAEQALLTGIAAHPGQLPTWLKLAGLRQVAGAPLEPLRLAFKTRMRVDAATGKTTLDVGINGASAAVTSNSANLAVWMMLAAIDGKAAPGASPYAARLAAWKAALKVADETGASGGAVVDDPGLKIMQKLAAADQLEPAILLLQYRESYRPELERWKAAHPNGVKKFVDTYGLQP